jgi:hypothetical protein
MLDRFFFLWGRPHKASWSSRVVFFDESFVLCCWYHYCTCCRAVVLIIGNMMRQVASLADVWEAIDVSIPTLGSEAHCIMNEWILISCWINGKQASRAPCDDGTMVWMTDAASESHKMTNLKFWQNTRNSSQWPTTMTHASCKRHMQSNCSFSPLHTSTWVQ